MSSPFANFPSMNFFRKYPSINPLKTSDDEPDIITIEYGMPEPECNHNLLHVHFYGTRIQTVVTHDPDIITSCIREIDSNAANLNCQIIGLDIEWRPSYSTQRNPVATLQLCVGKRCLIIQLLHCSNIPVALKNFLRNSNYTFVGVGIKGDIEKLEKDYGLKVEGKVVDLGKLTADAYDNKELKNAGLKKLCKLVLAEEIEKPQKITMGK